MATLASAQIGWVWAGVELRLTKNFQGYCSFEMKIENKLGLSWAKLSRWAKLSHPNSIELRLTAVSRISCSFKSQTELVCYIKCIFNKCRTRRSGRKESHCRFLEQEWVILSIILTIWWTNSIFDSRFNCKESNK